MYYIITATCKGSKTNYAIITEHGWTKWKEFLPLNAELTNYPAGITSLSALLTDLPNLNPTYTVNCTIVSSLQDLPNTNPELFI